MRWTFVILPVLHLGRVRVFLNWWDRFLGWFVSSFAKAVVGVKIERRLEALVTKINALPGIKFVLSVGDLTDSGSEEQIQAAKRIMSLLQVPWLPVLGNCDIWPYERDASGKVRWNAEGPITFFQFRGHFRNEFARLSQSSQFSQFVEQRNMGLFENLAFVYKGVKFIVVDNVNRREAPFGLPGAAGWSRLYSESREWLEQQLSQATEEGIVVLSHTPLNRRLLRKLASRAKCKWLMAISGHTLKYTLEKVIMDGKTLFFVTSNALFVSPEFPVVTISEGGPEAYLLSI